MINKKNLKSKNELQGIDLKDSMVDLQKDSRTTVEEEIPKDGRTTIEEEIPKDGRTITEEGIPKAGNNTIIEENNTLSELGIANRQYKSTMFRITSGNPR